MASKTMKASVLIGGSISSSLRSALGTTKDGLNKIGKALSDVERKQRLMGESIQVFGRQGRSVDGLRRQYDELTRSADRLRAAKQRLATVSQAIEANNNRRSQLGGQLMGAVGAAVATGFGVGKPVMNAANFARENQLIGNTANMTREEVAKLGQTILAASKDTNQGADELQKAIGFLVAAGLDVKTAEASIRTIGRTTTAAGADIEDLSKASFTLIDALNIKPEGLQGALDMLAVAGKEGNVELKDMAKVLPILGSSFVAMKMSGTEAVATMGAALEVARKGASSADEAANNMQNFMAKVMSPETLKKAQKNFGLDLYAVIQKAQKKGGNPFEAAMQAIMKATAGDQKKIGELFQDMQVQSFLRPMIQNWDEYKRIKDQALKNSAGTTDRDFATMMETQSEQMKAARIAADRLAKTFGTALLPTIGAAAGKLAVLLDKTTEFVQANPKLVVGATKLVAGFVGLRVAVLGLGYAWTFVKGPFLQVAAAVARFRAGGLAASLGRVVPVAMRVAGVFRWIATAAAAIGGGPVVAAVVGLAAAAILVRKYWEPIKAFLVGVWDGFSAAMGPALDGLFTALQELKPAWDAMSSAIGEVWDWFVKLIEPVNATQEELTTAAQIGRVFGQLLATNLKIAITVLGGVVKAVVWVGEAIGTAAGWIVVTWTNTWDKVKEVVGGAIDWIMERLKPVTDGISWIMDKAGSVGDAASGFWNGAKSAVGLGDAAPAPSAAVGAAVTPAPGAAVAATVAPVPAASIGSTTAPVADRRRAPQREPQQQLPQQNLPQPAMAGSRGGSAGPTTVQQTNTFHITQQPGESNRDLARRITDEQRRAEQVKKRGALTD